MAITSLRGKTRKVSRRVAYDRLCEEVRCEEPYVYVPLHYQPEMSTSPLAGCFVDQALMIDILAKVIPDGWSVYVKEHQTQFFETWHGERASKGVNFYQKISEYNNVKLVDTQTSSNELLLGARACCTSVGTIGWEALLIGKPVLYFGYPQYRGCEGTFAVEKWSDALNAIKLVENGYTPDQSKILAFLHAVASVGFRACTYSALRTKDSPSEDESSHQIAVELDYSLRN